MNRWLMIVGVMLLLIGILVWECTASEESPDHTVARAIAPRATGAMTPRVADVPRLEGVAAAVLGRPLFSPARRPPAEAPRPADEPAAEAPPRLSGVIVGPSRRSAIFTDVAGRPRIVGEGGMIGRFTVQVIEPNRVTLRTSEGDRLLLPAYSKGRMPETVTAERPDAARSGLGPRGTAE